MKIWNKLKSSFALCAMLSLAACSDYTTDTNSNLAKINIAGDIESNNTRANDNGFANGDAIGVYVVDYNGSAPAALQSTGNHADNVHETFDDKNKKWTSDYDLYWNDKHTHIDVYGYYPYNNSVSDIANYPFEVKRDQTATTATNNLTGYEASDFLWGKVTDLAPTTSVIRLPMRHRMACVHVMLTEGSGFNEGEWAAIEKSILMPNVVRKSMIDLSSGEVKADGDADALATVPAKTADGWRAITIPQTVKAGATLFTITIGGQPYQFSRNDDVTFTSGKISNFTIRVDKKLPEGSYSLTLVGSSITPWDYDSDSYDATATAYVIVNSTINGLESTVKSAHLDAAKIRNLKITGSIGDDDFKFMREKMTSLQRLNLKDATVYGKRQELAGSTKGTIPIHAFPNTNIVHVVFPDSLNEVSESAFSMCRSLSGPLYIPEGCTTIGEECFHYCSMLNDTLALPSTLTRIEDSSFNSCNFNCELKLPDKVNYIGFYAFGENPNLHGSLKLPDNLSTLEEEAFYDCSGLTGDLVIPQKVKAIGRRTFHNCNFDGTLTLHDGITSIGEGAFEGNHKLHGTVTLPKNLTILGADSFNGCGFDKVIIPEGMENIGSSAFVSCHAIKSIVCKATTPPILGNDAFGGVDKDNTIVEVPERSINRYKSANGWKEFKNIVAIKK